ncbi:MAG: hypothetical protein WD872_19175, partial [Pirellulaceae bacterium]
TEFNQFERAVSQYGPFEGPGAATGPGIVRGNYDLFAKHFEDDPIDLEKRLVLHLKKLPYTDPFADWPHFVATFIGTDGRRPQRLVNTFHSPALAEKWLREMRAKAPAGERERAQSTVRLFPNRAIAESYSQQWRRGK